MKLKIRSSSSTGKQQLGLIQPYSSSSWTSLWNLSCNVPCFLLKSLVYAFKGLFRMPQGRPSLQAWANWEGGCGRLVHQVCMSSCAHEWCSAWPGFTTARTSLHTLLSATASVPKLITCHAVPQLLLLVDISWPYPVTSHCAWDKPWGAGRSRGWGWRL